MADPDLDAIVADLEESGVHLGPGTQDWISPEQLAEIVEAVGQADVPVHLVLTSPPQDPGSYFGDDLLVRVHDRGGPDGLYIGVNNVWRLKDAEGLPNGPTAAGSELRLAVQQWGDISGSNDLTRDVEEVMSYGNGEGQPFPLGQGLLAVVEGLADGTFPELVDEAAQGREARYEQSRKEREDGPSTGSSVPFGSDSGSGIGSVELGVIGIVATLVVIAATVAVRRARHRRSARRTFALPDSVLTRVRQAGDAELERRARRDVLALGESIDAAEMSGSDSDAWAAVLDHYEAAGRVLPATDAGVDPLDAVGAVVLAERGQEALVAARRGKAFTPSTPCFLNPLHGAADRDRTLEHRGRRVKAPVCAACRRDLQAGRRPDILEVVVRGTPKHYFETDREPWASTGYGALDPDLISRLNRSLR